MSRIKTDAKKVFSARPITTDEMDSAQADWMRIYAGKPDWLSEEIRTINFAKTVCMTTANLVSLDIGIKVEGSQRADWLQKQIDDSLIKDARLRKWIEYGCAGGTVFFKPNGTGLDIVMPGNYLVSACDDNRNITGVVFRDVHQVSDHEIYTRLEYHDHRGPIYKIKNRAFLSTSKGELGREVSLDSTIWKGIIPEIEIENIDRTRMLFGVFSLPGANEVDIDSPLSCSIFSNSIEELRALDIAVSRTFEEIDDSKSINLVDDRLVDRPKGFPKIKLPKYIVKVFGGGPQEFYQAIERPLRTEDREVGINLILNLIATKCGYSEGYFTYNAKSGITTATQVESDDRKTIQLIKDIRDALKSTLEQTIYALNAFADLYGLAPFGKYETTYNFGDITYSYDEDRSRWYAMATSGMVPKWMYLTKFEGYSEEEAKAIIAEAQGSEVSGFFSKEE